MKKLTLERSFSTPIEKVWEALTSADKLKKWWSPPGFKAADISVDFKKGGIFGYCFKNSEGQEFWGRGVYQAIEEPKFLSWLDTFTDSKGNPVPSSHYGMSGEETIESLVEFSLTVENGITTMKMVGENPHDDSMLESMTKGWNGMFDKLEALLKNE
ncbi:SRPBCC domain-containing protein [Candidatus Gracilibacteria bacterium]|nr:SRPBCC domain-containing protein [Candidatus Gracilibacteria bacterium]